MIRRQVAVTLVEFNVRATGPRIRSHHKLLSSFSNLSSSQLQTRCARKHKELMFSSDVKAERSVVVCVGAKTDEHFKHRMHSPASRTLVRVNVGSSDRVQLGSELVGSGELVRCARCLARMSRQPVWDEAVVHHQLNYSGSHAHPTCYQVRAIIRETKVANEGDEVKILGVRCESRVILVYILWDRAACVWPALTNENQNLALSNVLQRVRKLHEMWDGNRELVEEDNFELLETGRSDPMNKCFQVGTKTSKSKTVKLGECDGCYNRLRVEVGGWVVHDKMKCQCDEALSSTALAAAPEGPEHWPKGPAVAHVPNPVRDYSDFRWTHADIQGLTAGSIRCYK
ncbi:hypothetical protein DFH94DRAFT_848867 [Russula ochroleuca]|uniref:Uncharacterized protein n=1 Tax=Russula ochroleuca TaxID=152965 RepID=A0A9P5MMK9_9AGAM|nr:hypothetical protein DFH94DRAFT_848898 [Russula ochroleuca]KAF8464177.1 hypothetical protein DFH94DRAFT_848867 [Russula ochroleuca]